MCGCYIRYCFKSSAADGKADGSWSKRGDMTNELTRSAAGERAHLLVLLYILGEGEDVVVFLPVVRRGFAAISKVPPVMPAEAKSKGGGIWKFGCKGGVDVVVALVVPLCRAKLRFCTISPREKQTASTTAREYPRVIAFVLALDRANDAKTGVVVVLVAAVVLFLARRRRNGEAEEELSTPIADERRRLNPSAALGRRRRRKNVVVVIGAFLPLK